MLRQLHIQNYALIEQLDIDFESGFSVITGETGAGKSILLGALSLILGSRADSNAIRSGAKRCTAEATFDISGLNLQAFFDTNELDYDNECIIRRELTDAGKSRAFINDTPVSLAILKELSTTLLDIHSQHQNLLLSNADFQIDILDSVAGNEALRAQYTTQHKAYKAALREYSSLQQQIDSERENMDYLQFQHDEIASARLADGEQEELEAESLMLDNAESIKQAVFDADTLLADMAEKLSTAERNLTHIAQVYAKASSLAERIDSCQIEISDIESELAQSLNEINFDPERSEFVNDRLNTIYSLQKKYHKNTVAELLEMQSALAQSLGNLTNSDEVLAQKKALCAKLEKELSATAQKLSKSRQQAATRVEADLTLMLQPLGMPNVNFKADITPAQGYTTNGRDNIRFLFSANKNAPLRDIAKIASGGEIARVMLSLKALVSGHKEMPTIIFDEIDTGVSGRIADEMATLMQSMGQNGRQVLAITHLPQIAARGQQHYRVYKDDADGATHTHIEPLQPEQRVEEIAKMLSGSTLTEAAITNAKTLLNL